MKVLSVLSSLAFAALASAATPPWFPPPSIGPFTGCQTTSDSYLAVSSAALTSPVPCPGQNFCLSVSGQLRQEIVQGATISIVGRWVNKIVYIIKYDVGALSAAAGTPLPIPASAPGASTTVTVCPPFMSSFPAGVPTDFQFHLTNADGVDVYCQAAVMTAAHC